MRCLLPLIVECAIHTLGNCIWIVQCPTLGLQPQRTSLVPSVWGSNPLTLARIPFSTCPLVKPGNCGPVACWRQLAGAGGGGLHMSLPNSACNHAGQAAWNWQCRSIYTMETDKHYQSGLSFPPAIKHLPAHPCCQSSSWLSLGMTSFF